MKVLKQAGHQGDVQWYTIDKIPATLQKVEKQFIAESERSNSFHALFGNYDMYPYEDGFVIDVKEECILNHSLKRELDSINSMEEAKTLPKKDHRHSVIPKGTYLVGIQNRFDAMENMKKRTLD